MEDRAGRILALDLGEVRIGLAVSDPLGITANPLEPLECAGKRSDLDRLARLVQDREVVKVIVGLPLLLSGEEGQGAVAARRFATRLRERLGDVAVELWDERLTTVQAERTLISAQVKRRKRRKVVDGFAAVLILENYLESRSTASGSGT
jgi:putative Holliday junction resolvase